MKVTPLRHRLKFFRQIPARSAATGAPKIGRYEHTLTLWGQFSPLSVKDIIAGQVEGTQVTARVKIRYRDDIDGKMRVQHAGRMYEIVGEPLADNGSGREYLMLMLKGVSDDRQN